MEKYTNDLKAHGSMTASSTHIHIPRDLPKRRERTWLLVRTEVNCFNFFFPQTVA